MTNVHIVGWMLSSSIHLLPDLTTDLTVDSLFHISLFISFDLSVIISSLGGSLKFAVLDILGKN
jgi:hypothetical protein